MEGVYFETQRWIIERLYGWRGDEVERAKFAAVYLEAATSIVTLDGVDIGWLTVVREEGRIELEGIYLAPAYQRRGLGSELVRRVVVEAASSGSSLLLSAAKVNPARRLYERLGFRLVGEDAYKVYMLHGAE